MISAIIHATTSYVRSWAAQGGRFGILQQQMSNMITAVVRLGLQSALHIYNSEKGPLSVLKKHCQTTLNIRPPFCDLTIPNLTKKRYKPEVSVNRPQHSFFVPKRKQT